MQTAEIELLKQVDVFVGEQKIEHHIVTDFSIFRLAVSIFCSVGFVVRLR